MLKEVVVEALFKVQSRYLHIGAERNQGYLGENSRAEAIDSNPRYFEHGSHANRLTATSGRKWADM